jgi:hypothetical protein
MQLMLPHKNLLQGRHTNIYPIGASILIPYYLKEHKQMSEASTEDLLKRVSQEEYEKLVSETFEFLEFGKYNAKSLEEFIQLINNKLFGLIVCLGLPQKII